MKRLIQAIVASTFVLIPAVPSAQPTANEPIKTTLCELVGTPEQFNGKMVQIRAEFVSKFQWEGFIDHRCSVKVPVGVFHVLDDLKPTQGEYAFTTTSDDNTHPERLNWHPIPPSNAVHLAKNNDYQAFRKCAEAKFKWPDGGICADCPSYHINVTATGRFDHFETQDVAVRADATAKPFQYAAGDANAPLSRLVLQSVSDVAATPILPSVYAERIPRNVTLEEANELVRAFFRDHGENTPNLDEYRVKDYPDFQFFQALWPNPPRHPGQTPLHSAVDLRTGEVWSEDSCENLTSPTLKKLQKTIRNRIGLADEFRKPGRRGPLCDPGEPRMSQAPKNTK